ncbi:hypothetical protein, partial [Insolitispirillum peregrinum]
ASRATFDLKSAEYRFRVTLPIFPSFIRSGLAYHSVRISGAISQAVLQRPRFAKRIPRRIVSTIQQNLRAPNDVLE